MWFFFLTIIYNNPFNIYYSAFSTQLCAYLCKNLFLYTSNRCTEISLFSSLFLYIPFIYLLRTQCQMWMQIWRGLAWLQGFLCSIALIRMMMIEKNNTNISKIEHNVNTIYFFLLWIKFLMNCARMTYFLIEAYIL